VYVCVCVCMYVYMCVCVCVFGSISGILSPFSSPIVFALGSQGCKGSWLLRLLPLEDFYCSANYLIFSLSSSSSQGLWSSSQEVNLFEILNLLHRCIDSCWGFKALPTTSNYCGCPRSLLLYGCTTRRVNKETTIKVYSSTVKINERFGTAIAIWVFSIGSYSLTKGFIVICRS